MSEVWVRRKMAGEMELCDWRRLKVEVGVQGVEGKGEREVERWR